MTVSCVYPSWSIRCYSFDTRILPLMLTKSLSDNTIALPASVLPYVPAGIAEVGRTVGKRVCLEGVQREVVGVMHGIVHVVAAPAFCHVGSNVVKQRWVELAALELMHTMKSTYLPC